MFAFARRLVSGSLFSSAPSQDMSDIKSLVDNIIENNRIAVFSKSYCPYCKSAKELLSKKYGNIESEIVELDDESINGSAIQDYLQEKTGQRSVPNIFIDKKHIGGNSDLQALEKKGELNTLINKL